MLLHGRIPFRHATLAQLRFDILNSGRITANAGTGIQPSAKGTISFGTPRVDGKAVALPDGRGTAASAAGRGQLGYVLTPDLDPIYRPVQETDGHPLPVLATPRVAAEAGPHGIIPLDIEGEQIAARIVGVVQRFPSIVRATRSSPSSSQAATRLDVRSPGLGTPDELWLGGAAPPRTPRAQRSPRVPTRLRDSGPTRSRVARS